MTPVWLNLALTSEKEALAEALQARGFQVGTPPPPVPAVVLLRNREQATRAIGPGHCGE
ncbi:hypothetical protein [Thermus tenuipuniceus]|uniref:hypothetical protein n=1 Tax=Thermus tenuipuniceus TaxID=2078690 RepID=UPI0013E2DB5D|nr:hypothetical protein [Thermus tenuipuniceus]